MCGSHISHLEQKNKESQIKRLTRKGGEGKADEGEEERDQEEEEEAKGGKKRKKKRRKENILSSEENK